MDETKELATQQRSYQKLLVYFLMAIIHLKHGNVWIILYHNIIHIHVATIKACNDQTSARIMLLSNYRGLENIYIIHKNAKMNILLIISYSLNIDDVIS